VTTTETRPAATTSTAPDAPGRVVSIVGIALGALGLVLGLLLGLPGLICGIVGAAKGNKLGWWAIGVSVVCTIAGIFIGIAVVGGYHHHH
jgi:hypothetical protein